MIPFYRPTYDHHEWQAAMRPGAGRAEFETAVAHRLGAQYGIATAYARMGIIAILRALNIVDSDVLMPAYTCAVVADAIVASGNRPRFVDVDFYDYNADLALIKKNLTPRTRAMIVTHMFGYPTDVDTIRALIGDERVLLIEDRAQNFLATVSGTTHLRGDIGVCSFGPNKQLSTVQGGVIVTNSPAHYEKIKAYRDQELNRGAFAVWLKRWLRFAASYVMFQPAVYGALKAMRASGGETTGELPSDAAVTYFDFQARIGLAQLSKAEAIVAQRRALAEIYRHALNNLPGIMLAPTVPHATYAYYTLRVEHRDARNLPARLRERGIAVDTTYDYALPNLKAFQNFAHERCACAEQIAREVVNLPIYPTLTPADAQTIAQTVRRVFEQGSTD